MPMRAVSPKRLWRRGVSKRAIGPEESPNSRVSLLWRRKSPEKPRTAEKNKTQGVDLLTTLPHDVLLTILGFLPVEEVDENVKLVCNSMRYVLLFLVVHGSLPSLAPHPSPVFYYILCKVESAILKLYGDSSVSELEK